jgi:serine protease DegQ
MRKTWLLFSQAVTVALALLFVVATLKPEWVQRKAASAGTTAVSPSVSLSPAQPLPAPIAGAAVTSYSAAAKRASPAVVSSR